MTMMLSTLSILGKVQNERNALMQDTVKLPPVPGDTQRGCVGLLRVRRLGYPLVIPCTVQSLSAQSQETSGENAR